MYNNIIIVINIIQIFAAYFVVNIIICVSIARHKKIMEYILFANNKLIFSCGFSQLQ